MKKFDMRDKDMEDEYDFSNRERAPYAELAGEIHVVTLDSDVWRLFPILRPSMLRYGS